MFTINTQVACDTDYQKVGDNVFCVAGNQASGDLPTCTGMCFFTQVGRRL